ncbi:MAG: redoxin domain-containing protein [Alphaproteobacteria bacterium]|nr:redoxin domain-containing protein [Alphaproteobacteria bacterium]
MNHVAEAQRRGAMPEVTLPTVGGGEAKIGGASDRWKMVVVYRGLHCPICKSYTAKVEALKDRFDELETDILFVSGDNAEKAKAFANEVGLNLPVAHDMSVDQMRQLGLYVSDPRPTETDRPFFEPGLFVVNEKGQAHIVNVSNAPFVRPEPELIIRGITHIKKNDYPIRGTLA